MSALAKGLGVTGTLNVDGPGSNVLTDDLLVGQGGVGFMNITGGGLVDQAIDVAPDAQVAVSDLSANIGAGTIVVTGDDSRWNFRQGEFGSDGLGSVAVEAGGRIAATEDVTVGLSSTSQGSLHVTGSGTLADSLVSVGGDLIVGKLGQGTLTVDLGSDVTVGNDLRVGDDPSNLNDNVVTVTDPDSALLVADR
jgi:T5SS/PEP-CTERM-associated repeat protein